MTDQNPLVSTAVETNAGQQNGQGSNVDDAWQLATGAATSPVSQSTVQEAPTAIIQEAPTTIVQEVPTTIANPTITYGALAATIGIAAGLVIASLAGHATPSNGASASGSSNSNATALAAMVKPQPAINADTNTPPVESASAQTPTDLQPKTSSHRKAKKKDLDLPAKFAIEGDDELVGYDTSKGVIQTSARKTFLVTVTSVGGNSSAWQEWPANIHYKCDLNSSCTLTRRGGAVLYAQLKK
jgi:hypothetical protein